MPNIQRFKTRQDYIKWYREYREKNRQKIREYNRIYNDRWRKEHGYNTDIAYSINFPEKIKAKNKAHSAFRKGLILKQDCSVCGCAKSEMHHPDYSKPLDIIWLCPKHHKRLHAEIKLKMASKRAI